MELSNVTHRRLLIIDDNQPILETLSLFLGDLGLVVVCFSDPALAIQSLEDTRPALVISDIKMPDMNGLEVLEAVRRRDEHLPVILMTGHADLSDAIQAVKNGAFDFIMKPFDLQYLAVSVQRALRLRAAEEWEKNYVQILEKTVEERTTSLRDTIAELTLAKQKAEEASKLKSEFLTNITHEVRTPVNGIVGMIDLARSETDPQEREAYLCYAQESALRLVKLVEGIISLALVMSEKPEETSIEVRPQIEKTIAPLMAAALAKGIRLDLHIADDVPQTVVCSRKHLHLLLEHLADNAVKFTELGGVTVTITAAASSLAVRVSDTGIGIPSHLRQQVQEPFRQVDGSLTRRFEGMGLGLAVVKKIIELRGGDIAIEDTPGGGTTVIGTIPVSLDVPQHAD